MSLQRNSSHLAVAKTPHGSGTQVRVRVPGTAELRVSPDPSLLALWGVSKLFQGHTLFSLCRRTGLVCLLKHILCNQYSHYKVATALKVTLKVTGDSLLADYPDLHLYSDLAQGFRCILGPKHQCPKPLKILVS